MVNHACKVKVAIANQRYRAKASLWSEKINQLHLFTAGGDNWTLLNRPKDFSNCIERLGNSLACALMSFVFTQNISYDLKLAVNVTDTVYYKLKISQRQLGII